MKPPTLLDKKVLSQKIYNISAEDLGRVVHILDRRCEACIKKIDPEDLEIDLDAIDASTFWAVDAFVKECLPGGKGKGPAGAKRAAPKTSLGGGGAAAAAGSAAGGEGPRAKKARM